MPREKSREHVTYHVVSSPRGGWNVKVEHVRRSTFTAETKQEAVNRAKDLARKQNLGQVIVHRADGAVQTEWTYGKDPRPSPEIVRLKNEMEAEVEDSPEVDGADEIRPLKGYEGKDHLDEIATQIDAVYDEIRNIVARRKGDPHLKEAIRPLRERLESLQEREADAMERRFRSRRKFDPRLGREILAHAERLLKKE